MVFPALRQGSEAPGSRGFFFVGLLAAILVAAAAFSHGLPGTFILDDLGNLEAVAPASGSLAELWHASFGNPSGPLRRPVSNFSFALNLASTGYDVAALKATNISIHLLTGLCLAPLLLRLLAHISPSLTESERRQATVIVVALWLLHPMQVSTVLYIVQRMALLSALFSVLALSALVCTRDAPLKSVAGFAVASVLAVLSKENGALTPLLALAIVIAAPSAISSRSVRGLCIALPLLFGLAAVLALWPKLVGGFAGREFTLGERLATQPVVLIGYLIDIVYPSAARLAVFRDDTVIRQPGELLSVLSTLALIAGCLAAAKFRSRWPVGTFALLWFLACHAMESTFLPLELEFEHRNYLALLGPAVLVATTVLRVGRAISRDYPAGLLLASLPLALVIHQTQVRASAWSAESTLASLEVASRPDSMRANNLAAIAARREGDIGQSIILMRRMQARFPDRFFPWAAEMDFVCDLGIQHPVPWDSIVTSAKRGTESDEVLGYFNHITLRVKAKECAGFTAEAWDARLAMVAAEIAASGSLRGKQYLTLLRASIWESSDIPRARELFSRALREGQSPDVQVRVALFEAEFGDVSRAREISENLRPTLGPTHPEVRVLDRIDTLIASRARREAHGGN